MLVDEAYAEFSGSTFIGDTLDRHRNLIVGRTFAKAHGLAALRVGALVAHPDTLAPLRRLLPPYSLNIAAIRALGAAIDDPAYLDWYVGQTVESRRLLYEFCEQRGFKYWPSEANFVLMRIGPDASAIVRRARFPRRPHPRSIGVARAAPAASGSPPASSSTRRPASPSWRTSLRRARIDRITTETQIRLRLNLDGRGKYAVRTGIRFLDHMLELVARHGGLDLTIDARGDLDVDAHHTVEDVGHRAR